MNKVSIIGFGRFGAMLHALLSKGFEVDVLIKTLLITQKSMKFHLKMLLKMKLFSLLFLSEILKSS